MANLEGKLGQWHEWVVREIGGPDERIQTVLHVVVTALREGASTGEAVKKAHEAAARWGKNIQQATTEPWPAEHQSKSDGTPLAPINYDGIVDLVASDKSELGRSTLAAIKSLECDVRMRSRAFFATQGFRGRYGWWRTSGLALWILLVVVIATALKLGVITAFIGLGVILICWALYILVATPMLARRANIVVTKGRIVVTYGLFSTTQLIVELHWIRETSWGQTFTQKILNEGSLLIHYDTPNRGVMTLIIPGIVPVSEMQILADKMRNASQKLRQGNYYAKSFIG